MFLFVSYNCSLEETIVADELFESFNSQSAFLSWNIDIIQIMNHISPVTKKNYNYYNRNLWSVFFQGSFLESSINFTVVSNCFYSKTKFQDSLKNLFKFKLWPMNRNLTRDLFYHNIVIKFVSDEMNSCTIKRMSVTFCKLRVVNITA